MSGLPPIPRTNNGCIIFGLLFHAGHKEIEGLQETEKSGPIEMFTGKGVEVSDQDQVFSCVADSRGLLSSVGLPQAGKDVTIILHLQEPGEAKDSLDQEEKRKKLTAKIKKMQSELDRLTEKLKNLEEG